MPSMNEIRIIEFAKAGSESAFLQLYKSNYNFVYNFISKRSNDKSIVDDICSVAFRKAFCNIKSFDENKAKFSTWLMTIAINSLLDHKKKKEDNKIVYLFDLEATEKIYHVGNYEYIEEKIDREIIYNIIKKKIDNLSLEDKKVIDLFYFNEMTYKEITEEMNLSADVLKVRLFRAKSKLKKSFSDRKDKFIN